jgi:hypothetical protein
VSRANALGYLFAVAMGEGIIWKACKGGQMGLSQLQLTSAQMRSRIDVSSEPSFLLQLF